MFEAIEAVFFDLDGTLVDSVPDLTMAVNAMLMQLNMPPRPEASIRCWVGNGADNLIRRALANDHAGQVAETLFAEAKPLFKAAYREHLSVHTRIYPGVLEALQQLHGAGVRMACITNKPGEFAVPLVDKLGIGEFFEQVVGGECAPNKKPAPDALLLAAERMKLSVERALMVGDSKNDIGAARNAGCAVVAVPYGYNHGEDIRAAEPDAVIDSLTELPALLR